MSSRLVRGYEVYDLEAYAMEVDFGDRVAVLLRRRDRIPDMRGDHVPEGDAEIVTGLELTRIETQGTGIIEPSFNLAKRAGVAQRFMDSLWAAGVRPTDIKDRRDEITALKAHLEDMRTIGMTAAAKAIKRALR